MSVKSIDQLLREMRDSSGYVEKTASDKSSDATSELLMSFKGRVKEDMESDRLYKRASDVAKEFSRAVSKQVEESFSSDGLVEKIASAVVDRLIKIAVDPVDEIITEGDDSGVPADPMTSVEEEASLVSGEAELAEAKKRKVLSRQYVEGAEADDQQEAAAEKVAIDRSVLQSLINLIDNE